MEALRSLVGDEWWRRYLCTLALLLALGALQLAFRWTMHLLGWW